MRRAEGVEIGPGHYEVLIARKMPSDVLQDLQRPLDEDVERARSTRPLGDAMQEDSWTAPWMYRQSRQVLLAPDQSRDG